MVDWARSRVTRKPLHERIQRRRREPVSGDKSLDRRPEKKSGGFGDLGPRVASALVLVLLAVATLISGGHVFVLFWLLAAFAISWEWQSLIGGERRFARLAVSGVALAAAAGLAHSGEIAAGGLVVFALSGVVAILAGPSRRIWALTGVIYSGALMIAVCVLRDSPEVGLLSIAWLFALVWGTDVFAYFGGRIVGGPKLWPRVSAGKTWSGTVIGRIERRLAGACHRSFRGARRGQEHADLSRKSDRVRAARRSAISSNPLSSGVSASRIRAG